MSNIEYSKIEIQNSSFVEVSLMTADYRIISLISRAQHCLMLHLKTRFQEAGIEKITPVQTGILFLLKQKSYTMTELSQTLAIDNSAVTGMVDRLEKSGLAVRKANPGDRRAYLISITRYGLKEISKAYAVIRKVNDDILKEFTEAEVETFKKMLNSFLVKLSKEKQAG